MLRRAFITFIVMGSLVGLIVLIAVFTLPSKAPVIRPVHRALPTRAQPWPHGLGTRTQVYDTTFIRASNNIELLSIDYTGLNTAAADVTVHMQVTNTAGLSEPAWLRSASAFAVHSAAARGYNIHTTVVAQGANYDVTITADALPTDGLGQPTCEAAFSSANALGLFVDGPDGTFVIQLLSPPAPAGYCFDEPVKLSAKCEDTLAALAALNAGDADRLRAYQHAHGKRARARALALYNTALKKESATRSRDNTIAASCSVPQPSPGYRL